MWSIIDMSGFAIYRYFKWKCWIKCNRMYVPHTNICIYMILFTYWGER
jgi:hypothetical protein